MTDTPGSGRAGDGEENADAPVGDTTVRRPRVPAPPDAAAMAETDRASDTIIVRRGSRRRAAAGSDVPPDSPRDAASDEPTAGAVTAYPSRVAAPVRGSRKTRAVAAPDAVAVVGIGGPGRTDRIPDASAIRRAVRAQARRRLVAVVVAVVALVVVLAGALIALVFAVGV